MITLVKEIAQEIIEQMSEESKKNFVAEDWREGIGNMDFPWKEVTVDEILDEMIDILNV